MGSQQVVLLPIASITQTTHRMSVRVHVLFAVHKDVEKFQSLVAEVVKTSKRNPGCISSGLFKELGGNTFAVIETWDDEKSCDKDAAGEHVASFQKQMGDSISIDVKKFTAV